MSSNLARIIALILDLAVAGGAVWYFWFHDHAHLDTGWFVLGLASVLAPLIIGQSWSAILGGVVGVGGTVLVLQRSELHTIAAAWLAVGAGLTVLGWLIKTLRAVLEHHLEGPKLISLSGYAQSGKDTAAGALIADGWVRIAFADKLKAIAYASNPRVLLNSGLTIKLADLVDKAGWEAAKEHEDVRVYLQDLGLAARHHLGESVWLDAAFAQIPADKSVVITDARFPDELAAVRAAGGMLLRIDRPGVGPVNGHVSEAAWGEEKFHVVIDNRESVETLHAAMRYLAVHAGPRRPNPRK